ncbi:hypothetical protein FRB90_001391 [Tulasnella sp. 427]|nr:hypothetical protein FRB90_001391 [Tulasnella sp. 427]
MGLAGTKRKQKIQADPRNTAWVDDASRFGQAYLAKFGWSSSDGLGANKDGRTNHIAIAQKLNMLGIGANRPDGPEAIAWKQNQDFESVLRRLNQESQSGSETPLERSEATPTKEAAEASDKGDDEKKRKEEKRKRKEEKRARKEEKARSKLEKEDTAEVAAVAAEASSSSSTPQPSAGPKVVRMAARHRASKAMLSSTTALAEILGESSTAPAPREPSPPPPQPTLTSISDEKIKTSTINMADYFRSKIQAKAKSTSTTPAPEIQQDEQPDEERSSFGLGARRAFSFPAVQPSYGPPPAFRAFQTVEDSQTTSLEEVKAGDGDVGPADVVAKEERSSKKKKRKGSGVDETAADEGRKKKKKRKDE